MTKEEREESQRRTREVLRQAKLNVATLRADIEIQVQNLQQAEHYLTDFLNDPLGNHAHKLDEAVRLLVTDGIERKARELVAESARVEKLNKLVAEFD